MGAFATLSTDEVLEFGWGQPQLVASPDSLEVYSNTAYARLSMTRIEQTWMLQRAQSVHFHCKTFAFDLFVFGWCEGASVD
jgi:hypothetical protein